MQAERADRKAHHHATVGLDKWPTVPTPQRIFAHVASRRACAVRRCRMGIVRYSRPVSVEYRVDNRAAAADEPGVARHRGDLPEMSRPASRLLPARRPTRHRGRWRQARDLPHLCGHGHRAHPAAQQDSAHLRIVSSRRRRIVGRGDMDGFEILPLPQHHLPLPRQFQTGHKGRGPTGALQPGAARWLAGRLGARQAGADRVRRPRVVLAAAAGCARGPRPRCEAAADAGR